MSLVIIAKGQYPIPYRTRKSSPSAPMVLCLKAWESRTLPGNKYFKYFKYFKFLFYESSKLPKIPQKERFEF